VTHRPNDLKPEDANPDPPLSEYEQYFPMALRRELTEAFREDIIELQTMLDRDLSAWLDADPLPEYATLPR
tara:strand:+ start:1944 stop:2156 length:213 start_codon:yes stop_codon:yes gene_type:complete